MAKKKTAGTRAGRSRRGQGEQFTEANENAVEVRTAISQGDLALPPVEDYQHHRKTIMGYFDQLKAAQGRYRKALKTAQAAGIDTDAMMEAKRIKDANDPKATMTRLNQLAFALEQEGVPIRLVIEDTLSGDTVEMIERRFFEDGKSGRAFECKYPDDSDLYRHALDAWTRGQSTLLNVGEEMDLKSPPNLPGQEGSQETAH